MLTRDAVEAYVPTDDEYEGSLALLVDETIPTDEQIAEAFEVDEFVDPDCLVCWDRGCVMCR